MNTITMASTTQDPEVKRLLGLEGDMGAMIGLNADWAKNAIMAGGNYGEIFAANIGEATAIGLARGYLTNPQALSFIEENPDAFSVDQQVKIQALDSAGRLKLQKAGVWANRWPEHRKVWLEEWDRLKAA